MFEGTEPHVGRRGASRQGWRKINVRATIMELREEHPKASRDKLTDLLYERLQSDEDVGMSACDWLIALCEQSWHMNKERAEQKQVELQKVAAKRTAATLGEIKEQFLVLNWQMLNGKRLRHCSGNYVATVCSPLAKAGKKAGNKLMGEVFSEAELKVYLKG